MKLSLSGYEILDWNSFSLRITPPNPFWFVEFLLKIPLLAWWGFLCKVICPLSLAIYSIFFSSALTLENLMSMCHRDGALVLFLTGVL